MEISASESDPSESESDSFLGANKNDDDDDDDEEEEEEEAAESAGGGKADSDCTGTGVTPEDESDALFRVGLLPDARILPRTCCRRRRERQAAREGEIRDRGGAGTVPGAPSLSLGVVVPCGAFKIKYFTVPFRLRETLITLVDSLNACGVDFQK